jgi:hypothetical protein
MWDRLGATISIDTAGDNSRRSLTDITSTN